jgi:EAL domain-containing protein (putative c-di-GMP-specific phosphodiesterase class I)
VLGRALSDAAGWVKLAARLGIEAPSVAVNLSPTQLMAPNLPFFVTRTLRAARIEPGLLRLEVTEGVLIHNFDRAVAVLSALHKLGVRIDVDDFGTGYSSLGYVQRLPIDALKIDRSFVSRLDDGDGDEAASIVASVLSLAASLRLEVIAEGVETSAQLRRLRELECPLAQGFHISHPMPNDQFMSLVEARLPRPDPLVAGVSSAGG